MIGLISDTHGELDPRVTTLFAGVEHILHAGDVCGGGVVARLERIAPVTAVMGNCDHDPSLRSMEVVVVGGLKFLVHHIVPFENRRAEIFASIERVKPDIVLFGHTHQPHDSVRAGVRYLNPGSVTQGRGGASRSVAILDTDLSPAVFRIHELR